MNTPVAGGTGDTTPPTAPTNLSATAASPTQVNLSWSAATDNVAVTGYRVERCQGAGCSIFAEIAPADGDDVLRITGRSASTQLLLSRARDRRRHQPRPLLGDRDRDHAGRRRTRQPPTAPTSLSATAASSTQVNLSWTAATDNVAVTGYRVERCQGAGCTTFAEIAAPSGTGTTYNDTTVVADSTYRYRVRATDAAPNLGPYTRSPPRPPRRPRTRRRRRHRRA